MDLDKFVSVLEEKIFPLYEQKFVDNQRELLELLHSQGLEKDQIIAGLIQGMSQTSFRLATKLSFVLVYSLLAQSEEEDISDVMKKVEQMLH
ncbi:hypothetical protein [Brevibacillus sp. FIR094]|uniref:hypothetical protein n=1 Tax=Brevibacillus sp. FIR094 TaxID=3134809 RepID=UPI003D1CBA90